MLNKIRIGIRNRVISQIRIRMKVMRIRMKVMGIRNTEFCHLHIDGDQDPDPGYHFEGNPDPTFE